MAEFFELRDGFFAKCFSNPALLARITGRRTLAGSNR
jgi:hypothetical protein